MKSLLVLASLATFSSPEQPPASMSVAPPVEQKVAVMCFSKGEQVSGMNKICYYDCLGSMAAITISSVQLCPLTINQ